MKSFEDIFTKWEKNNTTHYSTKETDLDTHTNVNQKSKEDLVIDLHGLTENEAISALRSFITTVKKGSNRKIRIIHGAGHHSKDNKPILKQAVRSYLEFCDSVTYFRPGRIGEGSHGVTIAIIK